MRLVYFWIHGENIDFLKKQGINFSSDYRFRMEESNNRYTLNRDLKNEKKMPKYFFTEGIEDISCIIGENGGGKTSLIQSILFQNYKKNIVSIYEEEGKFYVYKNIDNKIIVELNFEYNEVQAENIEYIYFNTDMLSFPIRGIKSVHDISMNRDIYYADVDINPQRDKNTSANFVLGKEVMEEAIRRNNISIVENLRKNKSFIDNIPYKNFRKKLQLLSKNARVIIQMRENYFYNYNEDKYNQLLEKIGETKENFNERMVLKFWEYICYSISKNEVTYSYVDILEKRKKEKLQEWFARQIKILNKKISIFGFETGTPIDRRILDEFDLKRIIEIIDYFYLEKTNIKIKNSTEFFIPLDKEDIIYKKILNKKSRISSKFFTYKLEKSFSSGEKMFLTLMIKLLELEKEIQKNTKTIILLLEELENFMHPEWQRKIIELLIFLKENITWMKNKKIQFILTSHTPFVIGDLPEKNISFIKEGEITSNNKKVFGGNIYNLLKEQFLMESHFGEFSKEKIQKVIKLLSKDKFGNFKDIEIEKNKEEIEFVIDSLEEELIRNKLKKMYNDYLETIEDPMNEIKKTIERYNMTIEEFYKKSKEIKIK